MAEHSEGGLGGFLKKLGFRHGSEGSRQTTRSVPPQPSQEELEKIEQERAVKARERYNNTKLKLQKQLTLDFPNIPDAQIDYKKELRDLEAGVKATEIYGKFHGGVSVKNRLLVEAESSDFTTYGDIQAIPRDVSTETSDYSPMFIVKSALREIPKRRDSETIRDLRKKHFVTYQTSGTGETLISYIFLHDHKDRSLRPSGNAVISFLMDRDIAARLIALIRKNPDFAEMFLQEAASGFEADPSNQKPGIKRIRSGEIIILNLGNFNLDLFNPYKDPYSGKLLTGRLGPGNFIDGVSDNIKKEMSSNQNRQIERYEYTRPFGVADPNIIP